jgi:epoxyqueuosine reductase
MMGDWVFGCDICQDVCPVNRKAREAAQPIPAAATQGAEQPVAFLDLVELLEMSEEDFRFRFAGTSVMRAKRVGMQRNACVALGNLGEVAAVPALAKSLRNAEPLVRGHAAWALGLIGGAMAAKSLTTAAQKELDASVLEEIGAALKELTRF